MSKAYQGIKDSQSTLKPPLMCGNRYVSSIVAVLVCYLASFIGGLLLVKAFDKSISLSDTEQREVVSAQQEVKQAQADYQITLQVTHNTNLKCEDALIAVGNQKLAGTRKVIAERDYNALILKLQQAHSCLGCELAKDGKSFTQQEGKGKQ